MAFMDRRGWDQLWDGRKTALQSTSLTRFGRHFFDVLRVSVPPQARHVLEVGCGTGNYTLGLAALSRQRWHVGLDFALVAVRESALKAARSGISNATFVSSDSRNLPFPDDSFDLVFSEGLLCYVDDDRRAFREMVRVTKPEGSILVALPNGLNLLHTAYKRVKGQRYGYREERSYSRGVLRRLAREAGLINVRLTGFDPAYSAVRIGGALRRLADVIDRLVVTPLDRLSRGWVSDMFGFYLVLIAQKAAGQR